MRRRWLLTAWNFSSWSMVCTWQRTYLHFLARQRSGQKNEMRKSGIHAFKVLDFSKSHAHVLLLIPRRGNLKKMQLQNFGNPTIGTLHSLRATTFVNKVHTDDHRGFEDRRFALICDRLLTFSGSGSPLMHFLGSTCPWRNFGCPTASWWHVFFDYTRQRSPFFAEELRSGKDLVYLTTPTYFSALSCDAGLSDI